MSNAFQHGSRTLFTCPRIRRPEYWQFIKLLVPPGRTLPPGNSKWSSNDVMEAYCLRCNTTIPFQKGSSAAVRNHMQKTHPQELRDFIAQERAEGEVPAASGRAKRSSSGSSLDEDGDSTMRSTATNSNSARPAAKKPRNNQPPMRAQSEDRKATAMDLLVRWICGSLEPLSTVTEGGLIQLISLLSQGTHELPDRAAMCRVVEQKEAEWRFETMEQVKNKVVGHYSLSAELWCTHYDMKYVALLCHHVNEDFEPETFLLGVIYVPPPEDGGAKELAKLMEAVLREWGLPKRSLSLLLTTNDRTICQLASILEAKRFPDIWAVVHNSLLRWVRAPRNTDTTAAVPSSGTRTKQTAQLSVASVVQELRWLADGFDHDSNAKKMLLRAQTLRGDEEDLMIRKTDCMTWDEVYDFLSELMLWRPSINRFFASSPSTSITKPTAKMWFVAEALLLLLRTLREVKQIATKDQARTLPFVIHCLVAIKKQLSQENMLGPLIEHYRMTMEFDATEISGDLLMLQKEIQGSITASYDTLVSEFLWSSLLDPRYAKMDHIDEDKREQCKLELTERAVELHQKSAPSPGLMHQLLQEENAPNEIDTDEMRISVTDEVSAYMAEHQQRTTRITDPFVWWRDNRERYPFLSSLARVWLGSVACSSADIGALRREIPYTVVLDNEKHDDTEDSFKTTTNMLYLHVSLRESKRSAQK
ncbi:hypothetical protein PR003_g2544 [Phytophthora rubi]|uniref:HAT C-terminal dimerisation domain-containing protein n=1 Tax=Phytophthora rubi TaxID=129364 RepID=A0A6A3P0Q2_9STRA|nr:hypothetical protein PR002_g2375 [Phytophthora rubi]KAE9050510.1 hypothetical protein PR001_g2313 [Phytophthora rubi]KAE9356003.1 hypothetical protein PR003_g2544 [Phytophthora rubi]